MKKFISKAAAWITTKWYSLAAAFSVLNLTTVKCLADPEGNPSNSSGSSNSFWNDTGAGVVKFFDNVGGVYVKWAWIFGTFAFIVWMWRPAGDKYGDAAKKIFTGVIVGYIVFALGGAFMSNTFSEIGTWFTS